MPRPTKPWSSDNPAAMPPPRVRLRIWRRQCGDANFAVCPLSGGIMRSTAECQLDHEKAIIEGGANAEPNLRFVLIGAHREKTKGEVAVKARVDARAKSNAGIKPVPSSLSRSRSDIEATKAAKSADRSGGKLPVPGPRALFGSRA